MATTIFKILASDDRCKQDDSDGDAQALARQMAATAGIPTPIILTCDRLSTKEFPL